MTAKIKSGMTAADVPAEVSAEAARIFCGCDRNDCGSVGGFGYAGGGYGPYRVCNGCGEIFGKVAQKDGNQELDGGR